MHRVGFLAAGLVMILAPLCASGPVAAEERVALVIGNGGYTNLGRLKNPVNDMILMAGTLRRLGFEVLERADADQATMKRAIQDFGERLEQAGRDAVGLFYYAGHGIQINGTNFLVPLHANISREPDVEIEAVKLDWVLAQMEHARNRMNILILDACRNNPLSRSFRSSEQGLSRIDAPRGTLIAYATAPGSVSFDGDGQHSPYTEALAATLPEPGVVVESAFRKVRVKVMEVTGDRQIPWESSSLTGAFEFSPEPDPGVATASRAEVAIPAEPGGATPAATGPERDRATPAEIAGPQETAGGAELLFWEGIRGSDRPELYRAYLKRFPDGVFAPIAKARLDPANSVTSASPDHDPTEPEVVAGSAERKPEGPEPKQLALGPAIVAPRQSDPTRLAGRWEGRYRCQGEVVGMALEIQSPRGDRVEARFEFFPAEGAPAFPMGSFRTGGVFEPDTRRLRLKADDWIERPWGFQRHDLVGVVQDDGRTIEGRVLTTGCSEFIVQRLSGRS